MGQVDLRGTVEMNRGTSGPLSPPAPGLAVLQEDAANAAQALGPVADAFEDAGVLVSGGAGFLGAAMVDVLVHLNRHRFQRPAKVVVVDNFVTGVPSRLQRLVDEDGVEMIHADISKDLEITADFQYAIHAAGIASPIVYRAKPLQTADVNVWGLRRMLELARS